MIEVGDYVYYVPSHDQEYGHIPSIGVVTGIRENRVAIYDRSFELSIKVPLEYVANIKNELEVIRLLRQVNNNWLTLQHLLYKIELAVMNFARGENLIKLIKSVQHYHIN